MRMEHGKESGHGHGHGGCGCGGQGGGGGCLSEKKIRKMSIMMASHHVADDA
ncbi:MAG: hypothetical protein GOU98_03355, partial [Candidatus Altiarchaeota archaeon]|nr:hypothetical protein [Candidatus Altiarchaeota archaeon]